MKTKIISFIIGGIIGFILWSFQTSAWAMPSGYEEVQAQTIQDPESYLEENLIDIPQEVSDICEKYGAEYNLLPEIGEGLCWRETRCTEDAENGSCKGIAQINVKVHKGRMEKLNITNIYDLDSNIHLAFDLLSELEEKNHDIRKSLDEYNGNGQGGNSKYAKQILLVARCLDLTGGD